MSKNRIVKTNELSKFSIIERFNSTNVSKILPNYQEIDFSNQFKMALWTNEEVCSWLHGKNFGALYLQAFQDQKVTGEILLNITEDYLIKTLGVKKIFHRIRLLRDILNAYQSMIIDEHDGGSPYSRFCRFQPIDMKIWITFLNFTIGCGYEKVMEIQNVTGSHFVLMNADQLKQLGIKNLHIKRFLREVDDIKNGLIESIVRVEQVWLQIDSTQSQYRLLYKHLKPLSCHPQIKQSFLYTTIQKNSNRKRLRSLPSTEIPERWSLEDVIQWLETFSFGLTYLNNFRQCQINGSILLRLSKTILNDVIDIHTNSHVRQLLNNIDELRSLSLQTWLRQPHVIQWIETDHPRKKIKRDSTALTSNSYHCAVCGKIDQIQRCSKCKKAFYCSREHQIKHWPTHAPYCISGD